MPPTLDSLLDQFLSRACPGPFSYQQCHHFQGNGAHPLHCVLGFLVHGNEYGTLPAALKLQQDLLERPPAGPVTLLLGNVDAARAEQRYLEEDFNRVFTFDRTAETLERRRAETVRPILDACDIFLDFHQTQTETKSPFWTLPWKQDLVLLARALSLAPRGLTRRADQAFSPGRRCLDEYVRDRQKLGLTVEVGFRGWDSVQEERAYLGGHRLLSIAERMASGQSLDAIATEHPPVAWYETAHVVTSAEGLRLRSGLVNWSKVVQGENLAAGGAEVLCPFNGYALFPKYPSRDERPPPELLRIARALESPAQTFET